MNRSGYPYVKQGRPYICLQQNPFLFAWYVGIKYKALRLYTLRISKKAGFNGFKIIVRYFLTHLINSRQIKLPFRGQFALAVHRGYKIFDVKRKVVTRVIDQAVEPSLVSEEIKNIKITGELECAPNILGWNQEKRWYVEEYIIGAQENMFEDSASGSLFNLFNEKIQPCLMDMIFFKDSMTKSSKEYIEKIAQIIDDPKLSNPSLNREKISKVKRYLNLIKYQLLEQTEKEIFVVFSHGDFSLVNILSTVRGIKVIDWEGAKFRGLLYDFYNFFLTEIYYQRADVNIAEHVNAIAYDLSLELKQDMINLKKKTDISVLFYRRLYYLERVNMLLERELTDKLLKVILRSIDVFQRFEQESNLKYQHCVDKKCF